MVKFCKSGVAGICLLLSSFALCAQDCHIALRGRLVLEQGEPVPFASVFVPEVKKRTVSDADGYFSLANLCEKTDYTVEVNHVQCAHFVQKIRLLENTEVVFHLLHDHDLKEVTVVQKATVQKVLQSVSVVQDADLENAKGVNLGEALKRLPGVTILQTGATIAKPVIQGLHSNRIAIVSNNVVLEGQQWGSEHAPEIDPFTAGKITVVKGAAGVRYGVGAMGGAIVIEPAPLREQAGKGGWLTLGGFSNGLGGVAAGSTDWHLPEKSLTFRFQGTAKRSGNLRAPDYWLSNTGASELNASAMAGWKHQKWGKTWQHELAVSTFNQRVGILRAAHIGNLTDLQRAISSPVPLNNADTFAYNIQRPFQHIFHQTTKYKGTVRLSDIWKLTTQYAFQFNYRREYDVVRSSAADRPQLSFRLWNNALDAALEHLPIRHWQGGVGLQATHQLNYVGRGGLIPDYTQWSGAVWAMERWRRYPSPWEFEMGLRYDYRQTRATTEGSLRNIDTLVHFGNVSGTAGVLYHLGKYWNFTLNSGYAWRPPHVNELFARGVHHGAGTFEAGRADLKPEKAWNNNLTLQFQKNRAEGSLTLYQNRIQDFIYLNPLSTFVLTARGAFPAYNYDQANVVLSGLDGAVSVPVLPSWSLEGRLSLLRGYRSFSVGDNQRDWLPLMPTDRYQYGVRWSPKRKPQKTGENTHSGETYCRLMGSFVAQQRRIPSEGLIKNPPAAFNLFAFDAVHTFPIKNNTLEIGVNIQNIINSTYREYLNFFRFFADEPGVNIGFRAKYIF